MTAISLELWTLARDPAEGHGIDPFLPLLSTEEQARAGRFLHDRDRWSYAAAHALLRRTLARLHGQEPLAWRFEAGAHGKPELASPDPGYPVRFNISHAADQVACLVSSRPLPAAVVLGVDIECLERGGDPSRLAERFFHPDEVALLAATPPDRRRQRFFEIWTLKEAVAKAIGQGIGLGFERFACHADPCRLVGPEALLGPAAGWHLAQAALAPCHLLASAVRAPPGTTVEIGRHRLAGTAALARIGR